MAQLTCKRCGEQFDTDREEKIPHQNTHRCPCCGTDHSPATAEVDEQSRQIEDAALQNPPEAIANLLQNSNGDVHLHLHQD